VRRIRVADSVEALRWLSKSPQPKADKRKVLTEYSEDMERLLKRGYRAKRRRSGHKITHKFTEQGGAIPPNPLTLGNNDANGYYLTRCAEEKIKPHPARFPVQLPESFIKILTDERDLVLDPFAGGCTTGEAAESLSRKWLGFEPVPNYLDGARFRFERGDPEPQPSSSVANANNSRASHRQIALL
jgi:site-specific DNA-methyltransferase (cytosine-N4-specific)